MGDGTAPYAFYRQWGHCVCLQKQVLYGTPMLHALRAKRKQVPTGETTKSPRPKYASHHYDRAAVHSAQTKGQGTHSMPWGVVSSFLFFFFNGRKGFRLVSVGLLRGGNQTSKLDNNQAPSQWHRPQNAHQRLVKDLRRQWEQPSDKKKLF